MLRPTNRRSRAALASFYMIAAGIITGLLAAVFGLVDFLAIPAGTRAKSIGLLRGCGNVVVGLFALSWGLRRGAPDAPGSAGRDLRRSRSNCAGHRLARRRAGRSLGRGRR